MKRPRIQVNRWRHRFVADDKRVITRLFFLGNGPRLRAIIGRVQELNDRQVTATLCQLGKNFASRHRNIEGVWKAHFEEMAGLLDSPIELSEERQLLIGAFFTMEYSIEAAALFNPSIVAHHDQEGVPAGGLRFIMSLRATGEGHVSSIVFRTGILDGDGEIHFDPPSPFARGLRPVENSKYEKQTFFYKLIEIGGYNEKAGDVLDLLPEEFTLRELTEAVAQVREKLETPEVLDETAQNMIGLARSNYVLRLPPETAPSEAVIFPVSENERQGVEDMRLVRFQDDDGSVRYYGTYTAYNGFRIFPQLLETPDFSTFRVETMNGKYAQNKGHALFPRKIRGWYVMSSRIDGENLFIMKSKNVRFWNEAQRLDWPRAPWEFMQVGNCGSPVETERGWLLLTHGVGPMRTYCIGACLLDLEDPTRIIGYLKEPLMMPKGRERDGYVPNVVYSCGSIIHGENLIIPYAMSDSATSIASVRLPELLDVLSNGG